MNLQTLAKKLQTDGLGQIGKNIFIGHMPEDVMSGILLRHALIGTPIDYEMPGYRKTKFNMSVRGKGYKEVERLAIDASKSLTVSEASFTGMNVRYIRPRTEPIPFPISKAEMFEFLVIFDAVYVIVD